MLMALAPAIMIVTALASIAIIPFGDVEKGFGSKFGLYGIDVNIGVLYAFAFGSLAFYGLMLGGWASGSKYSFLGAMRSAAQLISYEFAWAEPDRRRDDGRVAVARRHRQGAGRRLVRAAAVRRLPDLHGRRLRGDEPPALRPARGRRRAGRGLQHRVRRHALRLFLHGGVHEHAGDRGDRRGDVLRRLDGSRPERAGPALDGAEDVPGRRLLHLGAGDECPGCATTS